MTRYLPQLHGSAYDDVTIADLLSMCSGVRWNEDYTDPRSGVVRLYRSPTPLGENRTLAYLRQLPRAFVPGTEWNYSTGETDLAGELVAAATGRSLAGYLPSLSGNATVWSPMPIG